MTTTLRRILAAGLLLAGAAVPALGQSTGSLDLDWYGYVKLDASWDEALVNTGNFARWVISPEARHTHQGFNMTARETRLGFRAGSEAGSLKLNARWEADFYAGAAENKNGLQVRHAYVEIRTPSGWSILAGQTSDVISPLNPATLNYTVAWWVGNIGYRHPQLRVTRTFDAGPVALTLQGAAARTIGDDFVAADPGDSGAASGRPTVQGLAGLTIPFGDNALTVGGWAHRGDESLGDELETDEALDLASSSWGGYLKLTAGALSLSGEGWVGSNLDDYFGGIGQGLVIDEGGATAIGGKGGWAEVAWKAGATTLHAGFGVDDPDDEDLALGFRSRNYAGWGNVVHDFGGGLQVGLEYSYWQTLYTNMLEGTSSRVQGSVIYTFQ